MTAKAAPNDVDVVILPGEGFAEPLELILNRPEHWPFVHVNVARNQADLELWARRDFGTDRKGRDRGVLEVAL